MSGSIKYWVGLSKYFFGLLIYAFSHSLERRGKRNLYWFYLLELIAFISFKLIQLELRSPVRKYTFHFRYRSSVIREEEYLLMGRTISNKYFINIYYYVQNWMHKYISSCHYFIECTGLRSFKKTIVFYF